jgi:hypothetical protein
MRISDDMHVEWVEGEAVVLNQSSGELHYLNGTAALVFALIQEHGYEDGRKEVRERFGSSEEVANDLSRLLADMVEKGILVDG